MFDFELNTPTKVVFGKDSEGKLSALLGKFGAKRVLVHYGSGKAVGNGLLERTERAVEQAGADYVELGGVQPNPRLSLVNKGIELCLREKIDFILAIGGGSVIDSAKAIGMGVLGGGDVWDYYCGKRTPERCMPVGVVLTLAAAGSEMSNSSVITNDYTCEKRGRNVEICRPVFAVMNPSLTLTVPAYTTACGCADIIMHTLERYLNGGESMALTDALAEALMANVVSTAKTLKKDLSNYDARANMMWAGALSHNGLFSCGGDGGDWATHALGHEISAKYDIAHGAALTAVWGSWARYVYKNSLNRFYRLAVQSMGVQPSGTRAELALKGIEALEAWFKYLGLPTSFADLGIRPTDEELEQMAKACAFHCGGKKGVCRVLHESDMLEIYRAAVLR